MTSVFLDTSTLGLVVHPNQTAEAMSCKAWFVSLVDAGVVVALPEITDYELRRELLRLNSSNALQRLDELRADIESIRFVPITSEAMKKAAELWAEARKQGRPTAAPEALDGDVILAAQALTTSAAGASPVVATTNIGHLSLFIAAKNWQDCVPGFGATS